MTTRIGIIAGRGRFPHLFAEAARRQGCQVVVVAHQGESAPDLADYADRIHWVRLGQLGRIIEVLRQEEVEEAVLLGAITKTSIWRDIRPDLRGLALWGRIDRRQDDAILRAVAAELEKEGIRIVESTRYLGHLLFPAGQLTRRGLAAAELADVRFGWQMAKAIGALDIGQTVVVRDRTVLAVEAIEGTDAAIRRGGSLGRQEVVVVKVKKPQQDFRFDLPAIGVQTMTTMQESGARVLAVEAGQSLFFEREEALALADQAGLTVVGLTAGAGGLPLLPAA
ncbi:MAG: UDP-2,3-diacylglucosamine diphosphatase LpxI [Thermodesulfobacteriota bacterium]